MGKYIFPGADASLCPSAMLKAMEKAGWETHSVENISIHYALTIRRWHDNWLAQPRSRRRRLRRALVPHLALLPGWSVLIARQGNAACFQVVLNKNLDSYDRTRWINRKATVLGDRENNLVTPEPSDGKRVWS